MSQQPTASTTPGKPPVATGGGRPLPSTPITNGSSTSSGNLRSSMNNNLPPTTPPPQPQAISSNSNSEPPKSPPPLKPRALSKPPPALSSSPSLGAVQQQPPPQSPLNNSNSNGINTSSGSISKPPAIPKRDYVGGNSTGNLATQMPPPTQPVNAPSPPTTPTLATTSSNNISTSLTSKPMVAPPPVTPITPIGGPNTISSSSLPNSAIVGTPSKTMPPPLLSTPDIKKSTSDTPSTLTFEKQSIESNSNNSSSNSLSSLLKDSKPDNNGTEEEEKDEKKGKFKKFGHQWAIGSKPSEKEMKKEEKERKEIEKKEEKEREKAEKKEKKEKDKQEKERKEREKAEKKEKDKHDKENKSASSPVTAAANSASINIDNAKGISRTSSSISKLKNATLPRQPKGDDDGGSSPVIGSHTGGSSLAVSKSIPLTPDINSGNVASSPSLDGQSISLSSSPPNIGMSGVHDSANRSATQLETSRGLMTWGSSSNCKLGFKTESTKDTQPIPERLPNFNLADICSISCGSYYSAALTENGDVYMWGRGAVKNPPISTLGNGSFEDQLLPTKVESLSEIVLVSIGFYHSAAVKSNGELITWGVGEDGQLGHGDTQNQPIPKVVQSMTSHWVTQVNCGEKHTICLTKNGKVFTWGTSEYGQLGLGDTQKNCTPMLVTTLEKYNIIQIACGSTHCAVLTNTREVLVFGNGAAMGSANIISVPMLVPSLKHLNIERLSCGHYSTAALTECGDVYTWGTGQELGHGGTTSESHPKLVEALRSQSIRQISCGGRHMAFLTDSGKIYTCGKDPFGQLGHGVGDQNKPKKIESLLKSTFISISCGENHNIALFDTTRSYRDKFCWKLLETQRTFVRSLNIIRSIFLNPLLIRDREQLPENMKHLPYIFLSEEEIRTIFGVIEKIYHSNSNTLHLMNNRLNNWSNKRKVGDILLNHFKSTDNVFNQYLDKLAQSIHALDGMMKKTNSPVTNYFRECERLAMERKKIETDDDVKEFNLRALLLEPLHVIHRYQKNIAGMVKYTKNTHIDYQGLVDLEIMIEEKAGKVQSILNLVNNPSMLSSYIASQAAPPSSGDDSSSYLKEYDMKIDSLQNFRKTCQKLIKSSKKYFEVEPESFKEQGNFSEFLVLAKQSLEGCVDSHLSNSLDQFSQTIKKVGYLRSELSTRTTSAFAQPMSTVGDDLDSFLPLIVEMRKRVSEAHTEYEQAVSKLYSLAKNLQPTDKKMVEAEKEVGQLKKVLDKTAFEFDAIFKEGMMIQSRSLKLFYACMKAQQEYFERGLQRFQAMKPSFDALDNHFRQQSRAAWSKSIHETITTTFSTSDKGSASEVKGSNLQIGQGLSVPNINSNDLGSSSGGIAPSTSTTATALVGGEESSVSNKTVDPHQIMLELEQSDWSFILDPPTANEFTEMFLEEQYNQLVELLASPSLHVVQCVVSPCQQDEQARTIDGISRIFDSFNKIRSIMHTGIEAEVQSTANPSTLFRSNTTATKLMTAFTKMKGMPYLNRVITPLVKEIIDNPAGYEVDPSKINEGSEELMTNMMNLIQMSEKFTDVIIDSLHQLPISLREISKYLQQEVVKRFPDNKHSSVGGFIFLRFLCPAIIGPFTAGLVDEQPGPEATRALVLIGKVLQNLANGIEFGQKESFMIPVNRFIIGNLSRLNEYFDKLTDVPDYKGEYVAISSRDEVQKDIRNIHVLIVKNLSKVIKQLALYRQKDIIGQLCKTLVFLGDPTQYK